MIARWKWLPAWKWPVLLVVCGLIAIGAATAADTEGQLDEVQACLKDADLQVERKDLEVRRGRTVVETIPGLRVGRGPEPAAAVLFYSDDFEAEKARPEPPLTWEQFENVLVVKDVAEPEGIDSIRGCLRETVLVD